MTDGKSFDVFLSYHNADKPVVEALARRLEDEVGVKPFLDKWHLVPGTPWQEELERALDDSRACAVFIGPNNIGPWENEEMRSALDEHVKQPGFRVVPVLLPGTTLPERGALPRFLSRLTWVDFRGGLHDADAFRRLVAGIRGITPGRDDHGLPEVLTAVCPYRGLEAFDEAHARFFFGREAVTQHLIEALRATRFIAVLGPSGSGKSSVVRAGLLPSLSAGVLPFSNCWSHRIFKPGTHPLQELAVSLGGNEKEDKTLEHALHLLDSLETDERALHMYVRLSLASQPNEARCCIVVDQFEELFTLCPNEAERVQFIDILRYAASIAGGQTVLVITMRADFLARATEYTALAEMLSGHQFLISPMDKKDLRRAIEEPAREVGLRFEEGLVDTILNDMGREPGALPLMEHALYQLWEKRREDNLMTLHSYGEIGRVQGALARRAEEIFAAFSPEQQKITRRILLRLMRPGEGTEDTRRRATMSELQTQSEEVQAVEQVVRTLADARLLVTSGDEQVDVAHEALIRGWLRLRQWIDNDRSALRTHHRITEAAQEWRRLNQDEGVLFRGMLLEQAEKWREGYEETLNQLERDFLNTSVALQEREKREREKHRRREQILRFFTSTVIGGPLVITLSFLGVLISALGVLISISTSFLGYVLFVWNPFTLLFLWSITVALHEK